MSYYDSHTHLNDDKLYPDRQWYLQSFVNAGGKGLINVGVDAQRSQKAIDIAVQANNLFPDTFVKATIGFHPSEVCFGHIVTSSEVRSIGESESNNFYTSRPASSKWQSIQQSIQILKDMYTQYAEHVVAIGECGIDTHYDGNPHIDLQKELFTQQCDLAKELQLPIVIHSRDDFSSTWDVIKNYKNQKIYFHCRGYGPDEIKILQDFFPQLWIGFCGNISYPKAQMLRDSLYVTRPESMLIETDAPYLAPQARRWQTNQPAYVTEIYDYVASILSLDFSLLQSRLADNFHKLYNR